MTDRYTDSGGAIKLFGTGAAKRLARVYSRFTSTSCKFFWWLVGQAQKFFWLGEHHKSWRDISAVKGLPVLLKNLPCPLDTVPAHVKKSYKLRPAVQRVGKYMAFEISYGCSFYNNFGQYCNHSCYVLRKTLGTKT